MANTLDQSGQFAGPRVSILADAPGSWAFGRIAETTAAGLRAVGVRCDLVYLRGFEGSRKEGSTRTIGLGGTHLRTAVAPITRYLNAAKPDATIVLGNALMPIALLAGRVSDHAVIPWEQSFIRRDARDIGPRWRVLPILDRVAYRWAPAVLASSGDVRADLLDMHSGLRADRVWLVPNPVQSEAIVELAERSARFEGNGFLLCTVGRLARQKGIDVLLDALRLRSRDLPDWKLIVLGRGGWEARLRRLASDYGLDGRVEFCGHHENPYSFVQAADIFVHPARWDPCPLVLTEALSLGTPIVATDSPGGTREILADGKFGRLVPPEDPEALGQAIVRLAQSAGDRSRLAKLGPERARNYAPAIVAQSIVDLTETIKRS